MDIKILSTIFLLISLFSFSQRKSIDNISAYPNPFDDFTVINFDSNQDQGVYLIVTNVLGKTVFKKGYYTKRGNKSIVFKRKELKSGMYIYAIQSNSETISKRFVIK